MWGCLTVEHLRQNGNIKDFKVMFGVFAERVSGWYDWAQYACEELWGSGRGACEIREREGAQTGKAMEVMLRAGAYILNEMISHCRVCIYFYSC